MRIHYDNPLRLVWRRHTRVNPVSAAACGFLVILSITYLLPKLYVPGNLFGSRNGAARRCAAFSPTNPYTPPSTVTQSKWRQLAIKNPPDTLLQLRLESPKRLERIQFPFHQPKKMAEIQRQRQEAVKSTFERAWTSYKQNAWLKDEILPISGDSNNHFGGWGATLVDTLDTLWILDMKDDFHEAVNAALSIDFTNLSNIEGDTISVFETNIRFLGGFLSAYELPGCHDTRVLDKAIEVADMLYAAFDTPQRIPIPRWSPRKALDGVEQSGPDEGTFASFASLSMEFTRLSQLTGDMRYFDAVQRLTNILDEQQFTTKLPGMWPIRYKWATANFTGDSFSLGASADSGYEYLLKMYPLLGGTSQAEQYKRLYKVAVDTAIQNIFFRPMSLDNSDALISGKLEVKTGFSTLATECEHLTCFLGGMVSLGGKIFHNKSHIDTAEKLTQGCVWAYKNSPTGIMPENGVFIKCPTPDCDWDEDVWKQNRGRSLYPKPYASVRDARYVLRPEAIESLFYMYRIKGDSKYQDMAWDMFQTIDKWTKTEFGNAELSNVMRNPPLKMDSMQSFWMAEVIKYLYLIFSEPNLISLDDFVFNTEAHPLRILK